MTKVFVLSGPLKDQTYELKSPAIRIGRAPDNDLQIRESSVSRRHARVRKGFSRLYIEDLGSTNGTYLDGELIMPGEEYELGPGQPVALGNILMSFDKRWVRDEHGETAAFSYENADTGRLTAPKGRTRSSARNLALIYKVSHDLMQSLNLTQIFDRLMAYLFDLLKRIDRGVILLVDPQSGKVRHAISRTKYGDEGPFHYSKTIVKRVMDNRKPVIIPNVKLEDAGQLSESLTMISSVMCVPLISRSRLRGVIYVDSVTKPYGFRREDISLLSALSSPAAVAIENALLYSSMERIAEQRAQWLSDARRRLGESEARFKAVFDSMSSGAGIYEAIGSGEDFKILDLNRAHQELNGMKKSDVLGKGVKSVFPWFEETGLLEIFRRVWERGRVEHCSVTMELDGEKVWREYDVYRLPSGEIVAIVDDVTDRIRAEEEQKALQQQLFVSQKMESIGSFAGGTAHNFRNILQAISGNTEYLEMTYGDHPEVREVTKSIYDGVERGIELINNLLQFSNRQKDFEVAEVDLANVIRETSNMVEKVFDKGIDIKVELEDDLYVKGNQALLGQVFMNLFNNARDAMPEGGELRVEARRAGDYVVASVSDTGCGMDPETVEKIFDPFFTLKEVGEGTGLGLTTTHAIIEQHEGLISVSSKPWEGSRFTVRIPYQAPHGAEETPAVEDELKFGRGETVLIVDDEVPALDSLANLTESLGYKVIAADKPEEALNSYQIWKPDVVLLDRGMPQMDGLTCMREIVKMDPNARVVIISGYAASGPDGIDEASWQMIKGYLTKPCGRKELSRMLHQALGGE